MNPEEIMPHWEQKSQEAGRAMREWRQQHPRATLAEIEKAADEQINRLRASMIEEVAQASASVQAEKGSAARQCPQCGKRMQARGKRQRRLQSQGGQEITLSRQYQSCPECGYSFFPPG